MSTQPTAEVAETPAPVQVSVKVSLPGSGSSAGSGKVLPVEFQVSDLDALSDIKLSLAMVPSCQHNTSYDLCLDNVKLTQLFDDSATIGEVFTELGLELKSEVSLQLVHRPYTLAGVYDHLLKFREVIGLHFLDRAAGDLGVAAGVTSFNQIELEQTKESEVSDKSENENEKEKSKKPELSKQESDALKAAADSLLSTSCSLEAHGTFRSVQAQIKSPIRSLAISQWNPVPPAQQAKGDLLYLTLQTLEGETLNITAHMSGFFVNKNSAGFFNPSVNSTKPAKSFVLYDLVSSVSTQFSQTIAANDQLLASCSDFPETYLLPTTSKLAYPWVVSSQSDELYRADVSRTQLPLVANGVDGLDFVKDWNEDFQAIKELPKSNINERILRERLINKLLAEFTRLATETAINIVKGNLTPLNPNESKDRHIYLKNGVFYSSGINATGAFDTSGGDEAARYAAVKDLAGVKILNQIDADGVHNLVSCVVDYLGERVICQAPVPGIFNSPEPRADADGNLVDVEKVAYGLSTDQTKVLSSEEFTAVLKPVAEALHLKPHQVQLTPESTVSDVLVTSKDTKGIMGTDDRKYVIDLYRTTPVDIEFIERHFDESKETSYPHAEAVVRHEAVEEWYKRKAAAYFKAETERLEKEGKIVDSENDRPQIAIPHDQIQLNPDAFTTANEDSEDQEDVRSLSKFIRNQLVEEFLNDISNQVVPFDGSHLTDVLHRQGINMRYLGEIAELCVKKAEEERESDRINAEKNLQRVEEKKAEEKKKEEKKSQDSESPEKSESSEPEPKSESSLKLSAKIAHLDGLLRISIQEMIARALKHVLRKLGKDIPFYLKPHFVAHFHNCLLASAVSESPQVSIDEALLSFYSESDTAFTQLTSADVFSLVEKEVFARFRYLLPSGWTSSIRPVQLMREIAVKVGIQWKAQNYVFTKDEFEAAKKPVPEPKKNRKKKVEVEEAPVRNTVFVSDDIVNFVPVVKDSTYKPLLVQEIHEAAKLQLYKGEKDVGITLLNELSSIYEQVFGRVHPETCRFNGILAQAYSDLDYKKEASSVARKSCILNERTRGIDSFETITGYINAAFLEISNGSSLNAFKLYEKALQQWTLVFGEDHPSTINTLSNLAEILTENKLFNQAKTYYEKAIELSDKLHGQDSSIGAMIRYRYAVLLVQTSKYADAVTVFSKALEAFQKVVGPDDSYTKETANFITNIKTYIAYNKANQKKQPKVEPKINGKKKGKKKENKPDLSNKSVDDIMLFIEGK